LWTKAGGIWRFTDRTFSVMSLSALFTYPAAGTTSIDPTLPLTWTAVANAQAYYLYLGSTFGARNLVNTGEIDPNYSLTWTTVATAPAYYLDVGSTLGASDLVNSGEIQGTSYRIRRVLPINRTLYARLWTKFGGVWRYVDRTFTVR
jgi:hypothetical protein